MAVMSRLVIFVLKESAVLDTSSVKMGMNALLPHSFVMDKRTVQMGKSIRDQSLNCSFDFKTKTY